MRFPKANLHLAVLAVSAIIFFVVGGFRAFRFSHDLVPVYAGAACLLKGCNPYDTAQLEQQLFQRGGVTGDLPSWEIDVPVYPPSTFLVLTPLTLFHYSLARFLWFLLNGCLLVISAVLILSICPQSQRWLATILLSLILATSGILLALGQPAALAISLLIIAIYLFLRARSLALGAFLLMLSLAVKPQIGGLLAIYFLAQKPYRRYAAIALAGAFTLLVCACLSLRLHPQSANWSSTLRANLAETLGPGGSADPRQANQQAVGDTNLQTLTSIFFVEAHTFNSIAYAIFLGLLTAWIMVVRRSNVSLETHFLALAALSILSLLPMYHRFYDTRLLFLTVPAIAVIFQKRRILGGLIAVLTVLAVISVQYRVQVLLIQKGGWQRLLHHPLLFILLLRQQNLELLLLFGLYLAAILGIRRSSVPPIVPHYAASM